MSMWNAYASIHACRCCGATSSNQWRLLTPLHNTTLSTHGGASVTKMISVNDDDIEPIWKVP